MLICIVTLKEGNQIGSFFQTHLTIETSFSQNNSRKTFLEVKVKLNVFLQIKALIEIIIQPRWFQYNIVCQL